jgi:hypothetical protein
MKESSYRKLIEEQEQSGLSVRDFCSNQGFAPATFYNWKKRLREKEAPQGFVPLVVRDKAVPVLENKQRNDNRSLEFTFPNGTKLKLTGELDLSVLKAIIHL